MALRRSALIGAASVALIAGLVSAPAHAEQGLAGGAVSLGVAAPAGVAAVTTKYTTITFVIDNCSRCSITRVVRAISLASTTKPHYPDYQVFPIRKLTGNRYRTKVPSSVTRGLSFEIDARWRGVGGYLGYVSNIATRYVGYKVGARVTPTKARKATRAYACWSGTSRTKFTVHVSARKVRARSQDGSGAIINDLQAWSSRGLRSIGDARSKLPGNQEAWYC